MEVEAGGEPPGFDESKRGEVEEILNYRLAMMRCVASLDELPLSQRLVRQAHEVLLQGVRGRNKDPGNYRRIENWIGSAGCSKAKASFIPISPERLPDAMGRWEQYLHEPALDYLRLRNVSALGDWTGWVEFSFGRLCSKPPKMRRKHEKSLRFTTR